jgi:hypothetical protein
MKMAVKRFGKILVLVSILSGFNLTKAYSADGLPDGGLYMFGQAIQKEFQSRNDRDTEDYVTTSRPISPFAFSSSSLSDDFDGEEEPD